MAALRSIGVIIPDTLTGGELDELFEQAIEQGVKIPYEPFDKLSARERKRFLRSLNDFKPSSTVEIRKKDENDFNTWSDEEIKTLAISEIGNNRRLDVNNCTADEICQHRITQAHKNGTFSKVYFQIG